ncbi:MAG TPA: TatD family hydrolase [Candidatus Poseidoniaceae archaeon]|nr:TatD family hydrolase [Candidatus Poseidoniaceae archaeon]
MQEKAKWTGPILDNHFHLNRNGRFLEAAREFKHAGGTDIVLVHCPNFSAPPTTKKGHTETYADTIKMAEEVRKEIGLGVRVVLGPHPAAFAHQFTAWIEESGEQGAERAMQNYRESIDAALDFVHEGKAHAIGEVGRPHWKVEERIWDFSNALLLETMHLAHQEGIALQLHVEGELESTYNDMVSMAEKAGLAKNKLVRHYAPPDVSQQITQGITPSVLIGKGAIETLMSTVESCSNGFLLETDYMDDLRRPGAVLGPKTVPKRTHQLLEAGLDEEFLWKAHQELAEDLYGPSVY